MSKKVLFVRNSFSFSHTFCNSPSKQHYVQYLGGFSAKPLKKG